MSTKFCSHCNQSIELPEKRDSNKHWFWQKNKDRPNGGYHICNIKRQQYQTEYRRSKEGWARITYHTQKKSSERRNHPMPNYSLEELKEWALSHPKFDALYSDWVKSDYDTDKRPSTDRIDDYKPYTLDNLQLVTYLENRLSGVNSRKAKEAYAKVNAVQGITVYCYTKDGKFLNKYKSSHLASRETGADQSSITKCCKGKQKTAGGFIWSYTPLG